MDRPGRCSARVRRLVTAACLLLAGVIPAHLAAQTRSSVLTRDGDGRVLVRATRIARPLAVDGQLDDAPYGEVPPITELVQQEPNAGAPISEQTEVWILFDDSYIYFACRCWDEHPERIVANDMRRDSSNLGSHDSLSIALNPFNDQRNGVMFAVTPAGAMRDGTTTEERANFDWNPVWDGRASRFDRGWIAEMAVPFKSLRYKPGREQTWRIQIRRNIRSKNELAYLTPVSPARGVRAVHNFSDAATLVGLEAPPAALNFEIKPYVMSRVTTDRLSRPAVENDLDPDAGVDVKYGVTESLTADFTYNTDFAQVEADEAQVNLTRFSLSFPEKRDFFLEGQDIFAFGNSAGGDLGGDAPTIFYSRRIGLSGGRAVPVIGGGRLSGKTGPWSIGALNLETNDDEAAGVEQTNFTVMRLRRDVLRRSSVGGLFTRRSVSALAPGANHVWGVDGNFAFYQNVYVSGYLAQSRTEGMVGDDLSYRTQFNYTADRYGLALDRFVVEKHFNPEVGLLRREDFRRNFARGRFSPRTTNHPFIRKWTYEGSLDYVTDNENHLESRDASALFRIDFHNSDAVSLEHSRLYEFLAEPFTISRGVRIPVGGYSFDNTRVSYTAGAQRRLSGSSSVETGRFYDGDKKTATFRGRLEVTPQLGVEPSISLNWIDLPQGGFTTSVIGGRTSFTMTPRMFVAALIQYSSSNTSLSTNLRFRWEYQPGSELFVVYTEGRSTLPPRGTDLESRGFVVKINRLVRF
jgi:hypothetical protein